MESIAGLPQEVVLLVQLLTFAVVLYVAYKCIRIFRFSWQQKNEQRNEITRNFQELNLKLKRIREEGDLEFLISQTKASKKLSMVRIAEIQKMISKMESMQPKKENDLKKLQQQLIAHKMRIEEIEKYSKMFSESYQKLTELQFTDEELFEYFEKELMPEASSLTLLDHGSELQHINPAEIIKQSAKLARSRAYEMGVGAIWDSWYVDRMEQRSEFSTSAY